MQCVCYLHSVLTEIKMYRQFPVPTLRWQSQFHADGRTETTTHQPVCRRVYPYVNRYNVVWPFWGKPSSDYAAPTAVMVKLSPSTPRKDTGGGEVWRHSFLTSTLGGHEWSTSRSGCFTPGQNPRNHWIAGCWVDLQVWTFCSRHKSVTTAHSHYTDRAISAADIEVTLLPYHKAAPLKISLHQTKLLNTAIQGADANRRIWQLINMNANTRGPAAVENGKR